MTLHPLRFYLLAGLVSGAIIGALAPAYAALGVTGRVALFSGAAIGVGILLSSAALEFLMFWRRPELVEKTLVWLTYLRLLAALVALVAVHKVTGIPAELLAPPVLILYVTLLFFKAGWTGRKLYQESDAARARLAAEQSSGG